MARLAMAAAGARMQSVGSKRDFAPWADPTARPLLRIEGLSKRFAGFAAVDQLSLDIYEASSSLCSGLPDAARPRCCA